MLRNRVAGEWLISKITIPALHAAFLGAPRNMHETRLSLLRVAYDYCNKYCY